MSTITSVLIFICFFVMSVFGRISQCMNHLEATQTVLSFLQTAAYSENIYDTYDALDTLFVTAQEINEVCENISIDLNVQNTKEPAEGCYESLAKLVSMIDESHKAKDSVKTLQKMVYFFHRFQDSCMFDGQFVDNTEEH